MADFIECDSDSNETIIISSNNDPDEPTDIDVENILKKYSTSSDFELKSNSSNAYHLSPFSVDELVQAPLKKRSRTEFISGDVCEITDELHEIVASEGNNLNGIGRNGKLDIKDDDALLKELYSKYLPEKTNGNILGTNCNISLNNSDEDLSQKCLQFSEKENRIEVVSDSSDDDKNSIKFIDYDQTSKNSLPSKSNRTRNKIANEEKKKLRALQKERKEKEKAEKIQEKERKKELLQQEKALKKALKQTQQRIKPEECMKYMVVNINEKILETEYGDVLKTTLKNNGVLFRSTKMALNLISWTRKVQTLENMSSAEDTESDEKQYLLILSSQELSNHVKHNTLLTHINSCISMMTQVKHLTIGVTGIDKAKSGHDFAITEVQMLTKCYWRFVNKGEDLAFLVMELTKAIAQSPYKLEKQEKHKLQSEYFNDCNKDTIRVDKNGNGLSRLWHQMLTMFPLARLETAEAIASVYSTPDSLFKAYDDGTIKQEELLQDLPIRRAQGPYSTVRRIGPELSRKCYHFFNSTNNVLL